MDKLNHYRQLIPQIISQYAEMKPSQGDIQVYTSIDLENDHSTYSSASTFPSYHYCDPRAKLLQGAAWESNHLMPQRSAIS